MSAIKAIGRPMRGASRHDGTMTYSGVIMGASRQLTPLSRRRNGILSEASILKCLVKARAASGESTAHVEARMHR